MLTCCVVVITQTLRSGLIYQDAGIAIICAIIPVTVYFGLWSVAYTARLLLFGSWQYDPSLVRYHTQRLFSHDADTANRALQTLAEYWGHPFGQVDCWPFTMHSKAQTENMFCCYTRQIAEAEDRALAQAARKALAQIERTPQMEIPSPPPSLTGLPPLLPYRFIRQMRGRVDDVLRHVALAINEPGGVSNYRDCATEVGALFVSLYREALERGVQLRLEGLRPEAPGYALNRDLNLDRAARLNLNEVLYRLAQLYGETDPRKIFPDNLDRVRFILSDCWAHGMEAGMLAGYQAAREQQEKATTRESSSPQPPAAEATPTPAASPLEETPATPPRERAYYPRQPFAQKIAEYAEDWSEKLKDLILDLETRGETPYLPQPLPPADREKLLAEIRSRLEPILTQVADAINQEETAPALVRAEEDAYHLFGSVGATVVDLALTMRLDAAAKAVSSGDSRPRRVRCKRISDIVLPQRPGSQGGWVEKYRRMRAWEGSPQ
jgi:hypothetical protein